MVNIYNAWMKKSDNGLLSMKDAKQIHSCTPGLNSCVSVGSTWEDILEGVKKYGLIVYNEHWVLCLKV